MWALTYVGSYICGLLRMWALMFTFQLAIHCPWALILSLSIVFYVVAPGPIYSITFCCNAHGLLQSKSAHLLCLINTQLDIIGDNGILPVVL